LHEKTLPTGRFKRDLRKLEKRWVKFEKLYSIITLLQTDAPLPPQAHPHKLSGEWAEFWECHIESDWLLIYAATENEVLLARTGTHADLFD
jgi:mRNA interferase YafQ